MRTTIDSAGRIVVPKALRDALRLDGGTEVEITLANGRLEIEIPPTPMRLNRNARGRLVATTDEPMPVLSAGEVRDVLEQVRR